MGTLSLWYFLTVSLLIYNVQAQGQARLVGGRTPSEGRLEVTRDGGETWGTVCDDKFDVHAAQVVCNMLGFTNTEYASVEVLDKYGSGSGQILIDETVCLGNESSIFLCNHTVANDCDHTEDVCVSCRTPIRLHGPKKHQGRVEIQNLNGTWSTLCYDAVDENVGKVMCRMLALSTGNVKVSHVTSDASSIIEKQWQCDGHESDLQNCTELSTNSCSSSKVAVLECNTLVRLQSGPNNQSGRVEVFHQGHWGTLCDDSFDDHAASVVCRMLDFNPRQAVALRGSEFGEGTGKIVIDELKCTGEEDDISDCKSNTWGAENNCHHSEDAAVECGTLIRLSNGPLKWSGLLEIKSNGLWSAVCDSMFNDQDASVVCRMLGYHGGTPKAHAGAYYGEGTGPHFDYSRSCYGNETDVIDCPKITTATYCNHSDDVGVNCFSETPVRLVGGVTPMSGRVEVYDGNKGLWKGVCNEKYGFTLNDAKVICKMIGHPNDNPRILPGAHYHYVIRGEGISHLNCSGTELDISDCRSSLDLRSDTCDYPDYIGINCAPITSIHLVDGPSKHAGRVEILYNETWGGVCQHSFIDFTSDVYCKMVHEDYAKSRVLYGYPQEADDIVINGLNCERIEADISDCKAEPWMSGTCNSANIDAVVCESHIRLVNGTSDRSGILEVLVDGDWRTACANSFDDNAASVACKMAGFELRNASVLNGSVSDRVPYINNITCSGNESSLAMCQSGPWSPTTCQDNLVATIDCGYWHTTVRLVNGETPYSGRVEVYYNDKWGTVCGSSFTKQNAEVVCRTLGYNFTSDYSVHIDDYGHIYNNVMINRMSCKGNEIDMSLCTSDVWDFGYSNCSSNNYYHSVGVNCLTTVQLVGGTKYMGRVEVLHQNSWGSICREKFQVNNIPVLCSMMGFNFTHEYQMIDNVFHTSSTQPPIIENLQCTGNEVDVQQCESSTWGVVENCTINDAAAISCHTPVKLVDGTDKHSGMVKVFQNGSWNPVLYKSSSLNRMTGKVICGMLGLSTGSVRSFPISSDVSHCLNISCIGTELDLSLCTMNTLSCGNESLGISCETKLTLVNGRTPYMGVIQFELMNQGLVKTVADVNSTLVACKSLGYNFTNFPSKSQALRTSSYYRHINIDRLICHGNETDIMDCTNSYRSYDQSHSVYQGINCQTPIRLSQSTYQHGHVEIQQNGKWYSICSDNFSVEEAQVVCRMLGHYHVENTAIVSYQNKTGNFMNGLFSCNGSEVDISQCSSDWRTTNCTDGQAVYVDCRSSIRLVDGPTKYKGRVEVFFNGKWGPICGYSSHSTDNAKGLCKALGFNYNQPTYIYPSKYSNVTYNSTAFIITNLDCAGTEDDVTECKSDEWNSQICRNSLPLEIECNTYIYLSGGSNPNIGYVRVRYNDTYFSVCGDNFTDADAATVCRNAGKETNQSAIIYQENKYGNEYYNIIPALGCNGLETDVQECLPTPWLKGDTTCNRTNTAVSVNCRPNTPIRLVGTSNLVEINYDGRWGTICMNDFDLREASVICNMLGYKIGQVGKAHDGGTALIDRLTCKGTEKDVSECSSVNNWYHGRTCLDGSNQMATVECSNDRVRLTQGVNDFIGRVEFQFIGIWGTVCDDNFDSNDAEVVCRQIGFNSEKHATIYNASKFGHYSTNLVVNDFACSGSETDLDECKSFPWSTGSSTCGYNNVGAGINCRPHTPIRLVDGPNNYTGRVEVEYKGMWGTICDRQFDLNDARVICKSLGLSPWSASFERHAYYGVGTGNITISDLQCTGDEQDLSECNTPYRWGSPYEYCYHGLDVSLQCDTPVRLRGGWTEFDGNVEVYINETWKPVCMNGFTQEDANTICKITTKTRPQHVAIKDGSYYIKPIPGYVDTVGNFNCAGTEDDLSECGKEWLTKTYSDCATVGINCNAVTSVRLMNGSNEIERPSGNATMSGRVEIMYKNTWGSICDDQFGDEDALVLCRMLNFTVGSVLKGEFGGSDGPIHVDDLKCLGIEDDVSDCMAREWGTHNCEHREDVAILCGNHETHNPCSPKQHTWLPNLELRYTNVDTNKLSRPINDSILPLHWYNVGNNTLPNKGPSKDHCGTHIPLYGSESRITDGGVTDVEVFAAGNLLFEVQMKHCNNVPGQEFYVYRLRPTGNENMGYCFGEGSNISAPTFVPESVSVAAHVIDNKNISFACKFDLSDEPLFYQVIWKVEGNSQVVIHKQYFNKSQLHQLELTDNDLDDQNIGLGVNLFCSVTAFREPNGQAGPKSPSSKAHFVGLSIKTPYISLRNGETKAIELEKSFPMVCFIMEYCNFNLQFFTPDYNKCTGGLEFSDGCRITIQQNQHNILVNISSANTGQFAVGGHFKVHLVGNSENVKLLKEAYKLPPISVDVLPEMNQGSRKKVCSARNDPHMLTFDGRQYEHHEGIGEYVLYRHKKYDVEVQHKISHCTDASSKAKCNCGVAVRAGRDVYVINVCDRFLDIGYRHCGDDALTVKKDNDFTYTIYLPYGTGIKVRIDNAPYSGPEGGKIVDISVLPSVEDQDGMSAALCGTLNDDVDDDFNHGNQTLNRTQFISTWQVDTGKSLFSKDLDKIILKPWLFKACVCNNDNQGAPLSCNSSMSTCAPGTVTGQHSCGDVSLRRSVRSLHKRPRIPVVMQTDHYAVKHMRIKRETVTQYTNETATKYCRDYFEKLRAFELCSKVPATHTNISVDNCVLDLMLTNNLDWIDISQQSMQDACMTQIHRNATVRHDIIEKVKNKSEQANTNPGTPNVATAAPVEVLEIENIEQVVAEIKELACLNNCSGHGNCSNGTCVCEVNYGASDCSLDIKKAPRLAGVLDHGYCDESKSDCTHIYVFGEVFVGTNLTCRLQKFKMGVDDPTQTKNGVHKIPGVADTLIEAMCPVQQLTQRRKRSTGAQTGQPPEDFVHGYQVTVSNDGENFSNESFDVYVYDSTCQTYQNSTGVGVTFSLTPGFCYIEGKCVSNGSLHIRQTLKCDTSNSKYSWTVIPTTTTPSTTHEQSTTTNTPGANCPCNKKNTQSCDGGKCVCKDGWTGKTCDEDIDECTDETDICQSVIHSGCQNQPGSYKCPCLRGYYQDQGDGVCKELQKNSTTELTELMQANPELQAFRVEITLDVHIDSSHSLEIEQTYTDVKLALEKYYSKKLGELELKDVFILSLRTGSLIVEHSVVIEKEEYVVRNLAVVIADMSRDGVIDLFGSSCSITNVKLDKESGRGSQDKFHDFLLCESYTSLHPCDEQHTCSVVNDKPACRKVNRSQGTKGEVSLMIIIGSSVGGCLLLIILILLCVVYRNKKQIKKIKKQGGPRAPENVYNDMDTMELSALPRPKLLESSHSQGAAENDGFQPENSSSAESTLDRSTVFPDGKYHKSSDGNVLFYPKW